MNKEDRLKYALIMATTLVTNLIILIMGICIIQQEKSYEGAVNGQIIESNKCWLDNGVGYCEVDNKVIRVDNYYEIGVRK